MTEKVINMVKDYTLAKMVGEQKFDVFVVWHCYILGNAKWLLATTLPDGMYYEVTYNKAKDEFYFDAYKKVDNHCYGKAVTE